MKETIELDQKIRTKNLELTKALQNVDRLTSNNVDLNVKLNNYTKDIDSMRFKIATNVDGTNVKWDSSINSSPQSLVQPIDLGGGSSDLYVITTLNYIETADPASSNFFAGTTPVLSSIGLQYSVST